jgi:hypothetical protein
MISLLDRGINASIFLPWNVAHFCSAIKTKGYVERNYVGTVQRFHFIDYGGVLLIYRAAVLGGWDHCEFGTT